MKWHPGEFYVSTWRIGTNALPVALSVFSLLFFMYVRSLHGHSADSYYSDHAGLTKLVFACDSGQPGIVLADTVVSRLHEEFIRAKYDVALPMFRMAEHPLPLNTRAPPAV